MAKVLTYVDDNESLVELFYYQHSQLFNPLFQHGIMMLWTLAVVSCATYLPLEIEEHASLSIGMNDSS